MDSIYPSGNCRLHLQTIWFCCSPSNRPSSRQQTVTKRSSPMPEQKVIQKDLRWRTRLTCRESTIPMWSRKENSIAKSDVLRSSKIWFPKIDLSLPLSFRGHPSGSFRHSTRSLLVFVHLAMRSQSPNTSDSWEPKSRKSSPKNKSAPTKCRWIDRRSSITSWLKSCQMAEKLFETSAAEKNRWETTWRALLGWKCRAKLRQCSKPGWFWIRFQNSPKSSVSKLHRWENVVCKWKIILIKSLPNWN